MTAEQLLNMLLVGGLLGMTGQGIRVIAGLKKVHDVASLKGEKFANHFDTSTLLISLLIGFMAGVLAIIALNSNSDASDLRPHIPTLLGAGYAGADFIEAFIKRSLGSRN
ncbi:MAG: hypothetical protein HOP25_01065 [Methylotenera sp.]|nr:hypothetical protein [Methylotenera sp.]